MGGQKEEEKTKKEILRLSMWQTSLYVEKVSDPEDESLG